LEAPLPRRWAPEMARRDTRMRQNGHRELPMSRWCSRHEVQHLEPQHGSVYHSDAVVMVSQQMGHAGMAPHAPVQMRAQQRRVGRAMARPRAWQTNSRRARCCDHTNAAQHPMWPLSRAGWVNLVRARRCKPQAALAIFPGRATTPVVSRRPHDPE
jgi:hypothetical protein